MSCRPPDGLLLQRSLFFNFLIDCICIAPARARGAERSTCNGNLTTTVEIILAVELEKRLIKYSVAALCSHVIDLSSDPSAPLRSTAGVANLASLFSIILAAYVALELLVMLSSSMTGLVKIQEVQPAQRRNREPKDHHNRLVS